jgi:ubiquinone/menaquinone biosynthesis C-methylase UbiE
MFPPYQEMSILDVGCGTGIHLEMYRKFGCKLFGIDTSPAMLQMARARLDDSADLRLGDATQMPYDDQLFDLVLCMLALHEMDAKDRGMVISEIRRVLKIDGRILFIDFHAGKPRPIKGWLTKFVILLSELGAGRRHFRNYRHFISIGGMPSLIAASKLVVEKEKVVGGDTLALHLLRAE